MDLNELTEEDKKALKKIEIKGDGDTFIRMWEIILEKNPPVTNALELLETAIQRALIDAFDKILPLFKAEKICGCIKVAEKKGHPVSLSFKKHILEKLLERTKFFVENVEPPRFFLVMFSVMDLISGLNLPLGEDWRLIKNKALSRCNFTLPLTEKQKTFYCPHRLDADFENGGLK